MASLDRHWNIGVPGWRLASGRHVSLAELLEVAEPSEREALVREHRNAVVALELVLAKLRWELREATGDG